MKKVLLLAALVGLMGTTAVANVKGDDKDKKKKECCKKDGKACAGEKKEGCTKEGKACCKKKAEASSEAPATAPAGEEKK